jgi:hypothetical protein
MTGFFFHCRSMQTAPEQVRLYGIEGITAPGLARALCAEALVAEPPDLLLVEGPPEVEPLLGTFADSRVELPVALVHYVADTPWPERSSSLRRLFTGMAGDQFRPSTEDSGPDDPISRSDTNWRWARCGGEDQPAVIRRDPSPVLPRRPVFEDPELWWEHLVEQRPPDISHLCGAA